MSDEGIVYTARIEDSLEEDLVIESKNKQAGYATAVRVEPLEDADIPVFEVIFELPYGGQELTKTVLRDRCCDTPSIKATRVGYDVEFSALLATCDTAYSHPEAILGTQFDIEFTPEHSESVWTLVVDEDTTPPPGGVREDVQAPDNFDTDLYTDIITVENNIQAGFASIESIHRHDQADDCVEVVFALPYGNETLSYTFARDKAADSVEKPPLSLVFDAADVADDQLDELTNTHFDLEYDSGEWTISAVETAIDEYKRRTATTTASKDTSSSSTSSSSSSSSSRTSPHPPVFKVVGVLILSVSLVGLTGEMTSVVQTLTATNPSSLSKEFLMSILSRTWPHIGAFVIGHFLLFHSRNSSF